MEDMNQIHEFAVKWCDKFRDQKINYIELVDHCMADDCAALGFEMDCGHALEERYEQAVYDYDYIADEDDFAVDDFVVVPVGKDNHHSVAEVVDVEYFAEEDVPLPLDRTKHIIRKCTDDDFDPPM